jgi:hypothetical protein
MVASCRLNKVVGNYESWTATPHYPPILGRTSVPVRTQRRFLIGVFSSQEQGKLWGSTGR